MKKRVSQKFGHPLFFQKSCGELNRTKREERSKEERKMLKDLEGKMLPKLQEYEEHLEIMGERNSYSKTDHDATFQHMKEDHMGNG